MYIDELFLGELPKVLPKEEVYKLIEQAKEGSKEARDELIIHNIRLVLYEVTNKFRNVNYDKKDLISVGNIGLLKAISAFDISKGYEFSTFAKICIDNEIIAFLRNIKSEQRVDSINSVVFCREDESNLVEDYENSELHKAIGELLKQLPDRDREIIMLYFGFYNDRTYTQLEIAEKFYIAQITVSRIIARNVDKLGKKLEVRGLIVLPQKSSKRTRTRNENRKKLENK